MALLTKAAAQQQLANEVKWWRKNYSSTTAWQSRTGWASRLGNSPSTADSIRENDYNSIANQWCGLNTNTHKKRKERVDKDNNKIFKEADKSLSGGKHTCHFIESWNGKDKFNWHFKIAATEKAKEAATT